MKESKKRYGAPKIYKMLINKGYNISLKKVQRLMNRLWIKSISIKKYKPYTSKNRLEEKENVLNRDFPQLQLMKSG